MAYRVILVPIMGDPAEQHALDLTRNLTDMIRSHIVGIHVRHPVGLAVAGGIVGPGYMTRGVVDALEASGRASAAAARDKFRAWQEAADIQSASTPPSSGSVTAEWCEAQGPVAQEIARRARTADLTVVARTGRQYAVDSDQTLQGALWESGRPVLLVPGESKAGLFDTVVIAWNDTREAAHAVSAAWSLIARARRIVVFVGGGDRQLRESADDLVRHLAWRACAPATVVSDPADNAGAGLLAVAAQENAGLIVMGAYSHGRLRNLVFGGATNIVLRHTTIPVLMTH
ncbi:universal stress protein [Vineibacter terrae]|uniref:Universal stress protein n=1 Tax=Vineibacter terrae TaxID=2586908 RepID=A0A5C8PRC6_9HYPH|nr:universal stress protein [Vineibacter terrae]TXL77197.1 universal stress protein [Vineibacter terrae]